MRREPLVPPRYPVTHNGLTTTGNVWAWIFWWYRNGEAYVGQAQGRSRRDRERVRHSVGEEVWTEVLDLRCLDSPSDLW